MNIPNVWTKCSPKVFATEISSLKANNLVSITNGVWTIKGKHQDVVGKPLCIMDYEENEILEWQLKMIDGTKLCIFND